MAVGLSHPKLELCIADGVDYLAKSHGEFDVIITDSPDPVGKYLNKSSPKLTFFICI